MRRLHTSPWIPIALGLALVVALRLALEPIYRAHGLSGDDAPPSQAFWVLVSLIAGWIWKGLEVAGRVTLAALQWTVTILWGFARSIYNGLLDVGRFFGKGFQEAWTFLRATYQTVLKPGWIKFWRWIDTARTWLEDLFRPVFRVLRLIRDDILKFYSKWIRPVLDTIEIGRKVLRVFEALGIEWAKALDAKLGQIEGKIDEVFRFALRELNTVINLVNTVVTVNGLFQRLALVRSIERDIRFVHATLHNSRSIPLTAGDRQSLGAKNTPPTKEELSAGFDLYLTEHAGPIAAYDGLVDLKGSLFWPVP